MLLYILESQIKVGQDDLALQLLWLLQALAAEAPTDRWADTMNEALSPAMSIPDWLGHGYGKVAENAPQILAAVLSFLASCASQCARCREDLCRLSELPRPPRSPGRCALRARRARGLSDDGTDCGASSAGCGRA